MGVEGLQLAMVTRQDCHLCDEMEVVLERTLTPLGLSWERLDVDQDPELRQRFTDVVPVLLRQGRPVAKIRVSPRQLLRIVRRGR